MFAYAIWVGLGASLGLWRIARTAPRQSGIWVNVGLFLLMAALVGARLSYVLVNRVYFSAHITEAPMVWLGGLSWPGAIFAVMLSMVYLAVIYRSSNSGRISTSWIADRLYPLLPPVAVTSWIAAWIDGDGYGGEVPAGAWWGLPVPDETGLVLMRWPLQLAAALTLLLFFWILEMRVRPLHPPGRISAIAVMGLLVHTLLFTFLCADPAPYWNGLRIDTWAAIVYLLVFLTYLWVNPAVTRLSRRLGHGQLLSRTTQRT